MARVGLFKLNYGTIKNLGLENTNINVKYSSDSNQNVMVGSICGYNVDGTIDSCYNNGKITLNEINSNGHYIGGISGNNNNVISNCYSKGEINVYSTATNTFARNIGGVCGQNTSKGNIVNSINFANIMIGYTNNITINIGGILGKSGSLSNCYNFGNINVKDNSDFCHIGGVLAQNTFATTIENVYNIGTISHLEGAIVGLICGKNTGTIQNSQYLNTSGLSSIGDNTGTDNTRGVDSQTIMPNVLSIVGNKFKLDNAGNPILYWQ